MKITGEHGNDLQAFLVRVTPAPPETIRSPMTTKTIISTHTQGNQ